jgi:uncharacterized membrane protein YphA (DoxX/SURF4 family)
MSPKGFHLYPRLLLWCLRVVGTLFLWSAYLHREEPRLDVAPTMVDDFARRIGRSWIVGAESLLGIWLLSGVFPRTSAVFTIVVLSAYSGAIVHETRKPSPKPCGCLSVPGPTRADVTRRGLYWSLCRNAIIMGACGITFIWVPRAHGKRSL